MGEFISKVVAFFEKRLGVGGRWAHVGERLYTRFSEKEQAFLLRHIETLCRAIKRGRMDVSGDWFRPITSNGRTVGYVVGTGKYVSSLLTADMATRGRRI